MSRRNRDRSSDPLTDAVQRMYEINRHVVALSAEYLADGAMDLLHYTASAVTVIGGDAYSLRHGCNMHLRDIARSFLRRNCGLGEEDDRQSEFEEFKRLQDRYPQVPVPDRVSDYVLRSHLTEDDRWHSIDMLDKSANSRTKHARALEAETIALFGPRKRR